MSTTVIISLVAIALFIMIAVALTMQAIEKSSKEKQRLENSLKARTRNFDYILQTLPQGLLPPDLFRLVCQCRMEAYEQLSQLDSKYNDGIEQAQRQLEQAKSQPVSQTRHQLSDQKQIKEIQQLLNTLYTFIGNLQKSGRLTAQQAKVYGKHIRRLVAQTSCDALAAAAKQALAQKKYRLAVHYYNMSIDKYKKENDDGFFNEPINQLKQAVGELADKANLEDAAERKRAEESAKEWDDLNKDDDSWKKKAIYD